jgi:hypothetical protein
MVGTGGGRLRPRARRGSKRRAPKARGRTAAAPLPAVPGESRVAIPRKPASPSHGKPALPSHGEPALRTHLANRLTQYTPTDDFRPTGFSCSANANVTPPVSSCQGARPHAKAHASSSSRLARRGPAVSLRRQASLRDRRDRGSKLETAPAARVNCPLCPALPPALPGRCGDRGSCAAYIAVHDPRSRLGAFCGWRAKGSRSLAGRGRLGAGMACAVGPGGG